MDFLDDPSTLASKKEPDYYSILGCNPLSQTEQIVTEYRIRARRYHPDKNLNDDNACDDFAKMQVAKDVLTDPVKRKDYDAWRNCGLSISYQKWKSLRDSVKTSMHWVVNVKHDPMIEASNSIEKKDNTAAESSTSTASYSTSDSLMDENIRKFRNYEI